MNKRRITVESRGVDFDRNPNDRLLKLLVREGFSYRAIRSETGYSNGQIKYRISKLPISDRIMSYRDGSSEKAMLVLNHLRNEVRKLRNRCNRLLQR